MKHLLNNQSEIIINTFTDYKLIEGQTYKHGDDIMLAEVVSGASWFSPQLDHYGTPTGYSIRVDISRNEIMELHKKIVDIETAEPVMGKYCELPF